MARFNALARRHSLSFRFWKSAAKRGHAEAQVVIGEALYRGTHNQSRDAESAMTWLTKGMRLASSLGDESKARKLTGKAALFLGFLHLDGEGTKVDNAAAVNFFRVAASHGEADAERQLSSIYSTGAYGGSEYAFR